MAKLQISIIPNGLSMLNLVFGFLSIVNSIEGNFQNAAFFIILALVADGFDGKVARRVNAVSKMGAEFDSLADLVSFGVSSGILLYLYTFSEMQYGIFIPILMVACAALRLARFNIESNPKFFRGMPTPAFGFFAAAFVLSGISLETTLLAGIFAIASLTMVSNFKYPTFKAASLKVWTSLLMICLGLFVLIWFDPRFILMPFVLYFILGPVVQKWVEQK